VLIGGKIVALLSSEASVVGGEFAPMLEGDRRRRPSSAVSAER